MTVFGINYSLYLFRIETIKLSKYWSVIASNAAYIIDFSLG
jgi:hypothetical protein